MTPTANSLYRPLATSKVKITDHVSSSINGGLHRFLPSEIHEENEIDEAGTTHKKPSMYTHSRNNLVNGNRASYSI
jgi:hypothetical protein